MAEALRKAREGAGPEALLVETRRTGGEVEVVMAFPGAGGEAAARRSAPAGTGRRRVLPRRPEKGRAGKAAVPPGLKDALDRMKSLGLTPPVRRALAEALEGCDLVLDRPGDPSVLPAAAKILGGMLKRVEVPGPRARVTALVGPTGVGKTTTLAKLAARAAVEEGLDVALVTLDTYRMAAVDQIRAFADLMEVPLSVVFTPKDLKEALARHGQADRVFIDTPGRGPMDVRRVKEIRAHLAGAGVKSLLVLPAGARVGDLRAAGRTFGMLEPAGLVITKWDETTAPGGAVSFSLEAGLPLAWITDGQEVPEDVHPADPERTARALLLGEDFEERR